MACSQEFKAQTLIALAANQNDYDKTAESAGISKRTLYRWAAGESIVKKMSSKDIIVSPEIVEDGSGMLTVADYLETAVKQLLSEIPAMDGREWAVAVGILTDKLIMLQGGGGGALENITRTLEGMPADQRRTIVEQATRIIIE